MTGPYVCTGKNGDLWTQFNVGVHGSGPLHGAADVLNQIAAQHQQDQQDLRTALQGIRASYTGSAAGQMQSAFQPLIDSLGQGSQIATQAATALTNQAGYYEAAKQTIQKHVDVPPQPWYHFIDPLSTSHDNAVQQNSSIDTTNQGAFSQYITNTGGNNVPAFDQNAAPPAPGAPTVTGGSSAGSVGGGAGSAGGGYSGGAGGAGYGGAPSAGHGGGSYQPNIPSGGPVVGTPVANSGGGAAGAGGYQGPPNLSGLGTQGYGGGSAVPGQSPISPYGPGGGPAGSGGGFGGGAAAAFGGGMAGGFGGGAGGYGGGAAGGGYGGSAGGYGGGASGGAAGARGSGAMSGVGGQGEAGAGMGRGASTAGAAGRSGGMAGGGQMGGAGGSRGGEDDEHSSAAYLVNEDNGNAIVGDLPPTVPPVIG